MEDDTIHMDQNFLEPSADLEALVGTLLVAINDQLLADESHAEWSMAAWQRWLDDEGYPIHEAIDQFYNQVASSYSTELESLKSELIERLHEPHGLELLDRIIDSQPEIAENLHHFIDQAISKANESYRIAGGTHTKAIVGGTVGLLCFAVGIGLKIRNNRVKRALIEKANTLQADSMRAFNELKEKVHKDILLHSEDAYYDLITNPSKYDHEAKSKILRATAQDNHNYINKLAEEKLIEPRVDWSKIEINLGQEAKLISHKEIDFIADNYAKSLANESLKLMKKFDIKVYEKIKSHSKLELFKERGYSIDKVYNNDVLFGKKKPRTLDVVIKPSFFGGDKITPLMNFTDLDEPAKNAAEEKILAHFATKLKDTARHAIIKAAENTAGTEIKKIDLSFGNAYDDARNAMDNEIDKIIEELSTEDQKIHMALKQELSDFIQKELNEISATDDLVKTSTDAV